MTVQSRDDLEGAPGAPGAPTDPTDNAAGPAGEVPARRRRGFWRRLASQRIAVGALAVLVLLVLTAVFAPWVAPHSPLTQDLAKSLQGPSGGHLLGTDQLGRDVLSRLIYGTRVSLLAALQGTSIALVVGLLPGLIAGYCGGRVDRAIMLVNDALMSFPALLLAIAITGIIGPGLTNAMVAIGIVLAPRALRIVRSSVLMIREETYMEAARSIGTGHGRILRQHVVPNVMPAIIIFAADTAGAIMLIEAGMSFLGVGAQPPQSSWGVMLEQAFTDVYSAPNLIFYPGIAIMLTVLSFNLLGDGIRDAIGREERRA